MCSTPKPRPWAIRPAYGEPLTRRVGTWERGLYYPHQRCGASGLDLPCGSHLQRLRFDSSRISSPPTPGPAVPDVELADVFLDGNRNVIVISGTVYNDGESDLNVTANDVEVTSGAGRSTLVVASPLLPWQVPVGGYQDFELQFTAPEGQPSVLLNVLGFTFEIEGLTP
jgi:hypothetical protein